MKKMAKPLMLLGLFLQIAGVAYYHIDYNILVLKNVHLELLLECLGVLLVIKWISETLDKRYPATRWWIGSLFGKQRSPGNVTEMLLRVRYFWPLCAGLLILALPALATYEEIIFRNGLKSGEQALVRSVAFGLVHMLVGVPLHVAMALTAAGLWFSYLYMDGGLAEPVMAHTTYNLIAVTSLVAVIVGAKVRSLLNLETQPQS